MPPKLVSDAELNRRISEVFRVEGYEGASISRLQDASGLGRSSLYHRFPRGKEDMAVAVLEATVSHFVDVVFAEANPPSTDDKTQDTPEHRLASVSERLTEFYREGSLGCLLETLTLGSPTERVAALTASAMSTWIAAFTAFAEESGHDHQVAVEHSTDAVAAIEGALVVARATGSRDVFDRTMGSLPRRLLLQTNQTTDFQDQGHKT